MSVLFEHNKCSLIDHREYSLKLYDCVKFTEQEILSFAITANLFSIKTCKKEAKRKRSNNSYDLMEETSTVRQMYEKLRQSIPADIKVNMCKKYALLDQNLVRELSKQLFESTVFKLSGSGGNNSVMPLKCKIKNDYFLLPRQSRFFCGCVKEQCLKLDGNKFDIVIADPPWWNKYIRRLKHVNEKLSYTMMYNEDIASIPVKNLLSPNSLVAIWCTNAPSNVSAVKDLIFPAWGVEYITTWYWMKVTVELEPLCAFGTGCQKQPYERLIIGKVGELKNIPETQMFMSIPSALHSHKPPLLDLLSPYVKTDQPQILELFARYLLPNTTSVGFEPLKWQHISLYENVR